MKLLIMQSSPAYRHFLFLGLFRQNICYITMCWCDSLKACDSTSSWFIIPVMLNTVHVCGVFDINDVSEVACAY